jgi:hypothetical protein
MQNIEINKPALTPSELEEVAGQFRAGRLADEGLNAAEYYARRMN